MRRQVAVGEIGHLVEQAQDRALVLLVLLLRFGQALTRVPGNDEDQQQQHDQCKQPQRISAQGQHIGLVVAAFYRADQFVRHGEHHRTDRIDALRSLVYLEDLRRVVENFAHVFPDHRVQVGELQQVADNCLAGELADAQRLIALEHAEQLRLDARGVVGKPVGRGHDHLAIGEDLVQTVFDTANQDNLARRERDILPRRPGLDQVFHDLIGERNQLRQRFVDLRHVVAHRADRVFRRNHGSDMLIVFAPGSLQIGKFDAELRRQRRQVLRRITAIQDFQVIHETALILRQPIEGHTLASGRLEGIDRDLQRDNLLFGGDCRVNLVLARQVALDREQRNHPDHRGDQQYAHDHGLFIEAARRRGAAPLGAAS